MKVRNYRKQNNLEEIENLPDVIENYLCTLPENRGNCVPYTPPRGLMGYLKGGITLLWNMAFNSYATKEVAMRRAEICLSCPNNTFPEDRNAFEKWSNEIAYHSLGGRSTEVDERLGTCAVCTCPLRVKIWNGNVTKDKQYNDKFPDFCWAKVK